MNPTHSDPSARAKQTQSVPSMSRNSSIPAKRKPKGKSRWGKLKIQRKDRVSRMGLDLPEPVNPRRVVLFARREKKNCLCDDMGSGLFWGCDENGRKSTERLAGEGESERSLGLRKAAAGAGLMLGNLSRRDLASLSFGRRGVPPYHDGGECGTN